MDVEVVLRLSPSSTLLLIGQRLEEPTTDGSPVKRSILGR